MCSSCTHRYIKRPAISVLSMFVVVLFAEILYLTGLFYTLYIVSVLYVVLCFLLHVLWTVVWNTDDDYDDDCHPSLNVLWTAFWFCCVGLQHTQIGLIRLGGIYSWCQNYSWSCTRLRSERILTFVGIKIGWHRAYTATVHMLVT